MIVKFFANLCRILVGVVLIFSGFSKAVDPLGSTYKFADYFHALHLDFMMPVALPLAILLNGAEFMIGIALITNTWMRFTAWMALIFMSFFTILTFILAIFNPVSDCGCFGDAMKLTNWQTFEKNLVFMVFTLAIFIYRRNFRPMFSSNGQTMVAVAGVIMFSWFTWFCFQHLPVIDFRPYKAGTHIPSQMIIPDGAPRDSFSTLLYYKKNGVVKEFTMENYPWQDSTWQYDTIKHTLVKEGYKPPIHDFTITTPDNQDITETVLNDSGYVFLAVVKKVEEADEQGLRKLDSVYRFCTRTGKCRFIATTASTSEMIDKYTKQYKLPFVFHTTDHTTLKTIVRSNPGLVLLKNATVLAMWSHNDIPELNDKQTNIESLAATTWRVKAEFYMTLSLFLGLALVLAVLFIVFKKK